MSGHKVAETKLNQPTYSWSTVCETLRLCYFDNLALARDGNLTGLGKFSEYLEAIQGASLIRLR